MSLGNRIREARASARITQKKMADMIGVQQPTMSGYESKNHMPTEDILVKIADITNVSMDYLFERTNNPNPYIELDDCFYGNYTYRNILEK